MQKNLGQHFLINNDIATAVVDALGAAQDDTVVEIGPGTGVLTNILLERAKNLIVIEKDPSLVAQLKEKYIEENVSIVKGDVRDFNPNKLGLRDYLLIGNIPYYITGRILRITLSANPQPRRAVFMVQKEVAERIVAKDKKESLLSVSVKAYGAPKYVRTVKRGAFNPPPRVDSAILSVENISRNFFINIDEGAFFALVKKGFRHKRKQLLNNLELSEGVLRTCGVTPQARAEDLRLADWKRLTKHVKEHV